MKERLREKERERERERKTEREKRERERIRFLENQHLALIFVSFKSDFQNNDLRNQLMRKAFFDYVIAFHFK